MGFVAWATPPRLLPRTFEMSTAPTTNPIMPRLERAACLHPEGGLATEWLETDGRGGYAASTVLMRPMRRYHGLLVAAPPGSARRHVFLARYEEHVESGGRTFALSTARFAGGVIAPDGEQALEDFQLAPWPVWRYRIGDGELLREVLLTRDGVALARYSASGFDAPLELRLRPLLPFREADALTIENDVLDPRVEVLPAGIRVRPYESLPSLTIRAGGGLAFEPAPLWYKGLEYPLDLARGHDGHEDQFSPGELRFMLTPGKPVVLAAGLETTGEPGEPAALWARESSRRAGQLELLARTDADPAVARCSLAADQFLYETPQGRPGVLAGFPWFLEWGRDTFISLPGLTLARGRAEQCAAVLSGCLPYLRGGLLPNIYGMDVEDSHYGSVDASLWFARAVLLFDRAQESAERVQEEYLPALLEIAVAYHAGTKLGIAADDTGLLRAGGPELNPTWMDARTSTGPVTPRDGSPVEINALWYSLLTHVEELLEARGERAAAKIWRGRRRRVGAAFLERFWLPAGYLADVWKDGVADESVRPNMVLAAALEHSPLDRKQRRAVVERARAELLTPYGLRTLSPAHPAYRGRYEGGPEERDGAYHQGTVWPWLLGFHCEAALRAFGAGPALLRELSDTWGALERALDRHGLNHLCEVFHGDAPHEGGGGFAQAWNTAEFLRARAMLARGRP